MSNFTTHINAFTTARLGQPGWEDADFVAEQAYCDYYESGAYAESDGPDDLYDAYAGDEEWADYSVYRTLPLHRSWLVL